MKVKQLQVMIDSGLEKLNPRAKKWWAEISINPQKWTLDNYGGNLKFKEGFWVVALFDHKCIWYNHIEEGFNISSYTKSGEINEPGYEQFELNELLNPESKRLFGN